MMAIPVINEEAQRRAEAAKQHLARAEEMANGITSVSDADLCSAEIKKIKARAKDLENTRKEMTKPLDESRRKIMDLFRAPMELLSQAEYILKHGIARFQQEEERKRREAAEAERKRIEANAARRAERAANKGDEERAEEIQREAEMEAMSAQAAIENATTKVAGIGTSKRWKGRVNDPKAFYRAIADGLVPMKAAPLAQGVIDRAAQASGGVLHWPGVTTYQDQTIASR